MEPEDEKFVTAVLKTPDGTLIPLNSSQSRHHIDANGNEYWIAGGTRYDSIMTSTHSDEELIIYTTDDDHDILREVATWGTRGINGDQPVTRIKIKDMDESHLQACLRTQPQMATAYRKIMTDELNRRWLYTSGIKESNNA